MKLHLVGGFLGSGKTTAIATSAKILMRQGLRVGVITNDQGKYLVDTHFFRLEDLPAVEVSGGCFCCNYDDFNQRLDQLVETIHPDVVFAELVGSCADLVATVIQPLLDLKTAAPQDTTFSVFTDARLLLMYLSGKELPFQENVIYIFEKQIEEASIVVLNKIDLLTSAQQDLLTQLAHARYANKQLVIQNSLTEVGVSDWLNTLNSALRLPMINIGLDYQAYGAGEQELAWFDGRYQLQFDSQSETDWLKGLIARLVEDFQEEAIPIGHLKFLVEDGSKHAKISVVGGTEAPDLSALEKKWQSPLSLLINARVETSEARVKALVHQQVMQTAAVYAVEVDILSEDFFSPGVSKTYPSFCVSHITRVIFT